MAAGLSTSVRAAASSMARGRPSSAMHTAAMSAATASSTSRSGATAVARSTNSATAACEVISPAPAASGGGRSRGGTGQANSPETPSGRRLVASTRTPGAGAQHGRRHLGGGGDDVLTGVQHDQHVAGRQRLGDRRHRVVARCDRHTSGGGDRRRDEARVVDRAEVDVADLLSVAGGDLDGEPGLAGARRAGECHGAVAFEKVFEPGDLFVPADQRRDRNGEATRRARAPAAGRSTSAAAVAGGGSSGAAQSNAGSCWRIRRSRSRSSAPGSMPSSSTSVRRASP